MAYNGGTGLRVGNPYEDVIFIDEDNSRIGINVEEPSCELDVSGKINADRLDAPLIECETLMATDAYADTVKVWSNIEVMDVDYPEQVEEVDELGNPIVKTIVRSIDKPLFDAYTYSVNGVPIIDPRFDYNKWIINGPSSSLPDPDDKQGWLDLLETILKYGGIIGTLWGLANLLTAGAAGEALNDAAKTALCGLKTILGLGSCNDGGGEDGSDGADGDSPDLGSIWLPISRVTDSGLIYFRDYDSIPFLNPFN
ncbi:hypothetical protein EOM60_06220, partial [Candidatus Saccharibacteria bacterium]|nr:hypothetical protein [Candidatus Saccharibacteria bacterium]